MASRFVADQLVIFRHDGKDLIGRVDEVKCQWQMPNRYRVVTIDHKVTVSGLFSADLAPVLSSPDHSFRVGQEVDHGDPPRRCRVEGLLVTVNPDGNRYLYDLVDVTTIKDSYPTYWRAFAHTCRAPGAKVMHDVCPRCGDRGEWRMLALFCKVGHGRFAG